MVLIVIRALVLSLKNVVEFLTLTMFGFLKNLQTYYYQRVLGSKIIKEKQELGCWQEPPEDVKEMIVKRMSFSGRVRLSTLCKSWRLASLRRDIQTCPQLPLLVHPQVPSCHSLTFSSLLESKVFKLRMPCPDFKSRLNKLVGRSNQTSYFLGSSRGWLVMLNHEVCFRIKIKRELVIFLVNPVSGAQHRLPPLQTIPSYRENSKDSRILEVVLSSPDVSKCMVAANIGSRKLLLCRPRDKSWSVFQIFDENDTGGCILQILFSSTGMLYVLVLGSSNCSAEASWIENHSVMFGDDEVSIKVIYDKEEWWIDDGIFIQEGKWYRPFLSESTKNELLLIYQIHQGPDVGEDDMEDNLVAEEGNIGEGDENNVEDNEQNESLLGWLGEIFLRKAVQLKSFFNHHKEEDEYLRTRSFRVYKFDPINNNFRREPDLGDQILFLGDDNSSLSLLARDFKELRGNCIYFATRGSREFGTLHTSREIGIFYLYSGKIERSFPSLEMQYSRPGWFMPSLW